MKKDEILDTYMYSSELRRYLTIRLWFRELLLTLWDEQESFSGKHPWGNSSWSHELAIPLIRIGVLKGELDEAEDDGESDYYCYPMNYDKSAYHKIVSELISYALTS